MSEVRRSITQCWRIPAVCVLCRHYHRDDFAVCASCITLLKPILDACTLCRLPLADCSARFCGQCIQKRPTFDKVFCAYLFEEPLRTLVHHYKYQSALYLCNFLLKLLIDGQKETPYQPDCLIPVPMHPRRLRERGFNHAAFLTQRLAKRLQLPYDLRLCQKIQNTAQQATLSSNARGQNLKQVFVAKPNTYQHVTIVDDLLTTGSTAEALATVLKQQGVKRVDLWCLARTPEKAAFKIR